MEEKKDGENCCATKKCCGKAACAVALLLVGGVAGFFAGRCQKLCPTKTGEAAVTAPAAGAAEAPKK